jgi:outer membrane murein-binding lipoprotein Lpp
MKKIIIATFSVSIVLSGCATASKDLTPTYTSPMQYQSYDCDQLASESQRIQARVVQLGGRLDAAAANDKAIAGVGAVLFWPALFALGGTKQQEADYSRLRGEYDAVQHSAVLRKCPGMVSASNEPNNRKE